MTGIRPSAIESFPSLNAWVSFLHSFSVRSACAACSAVMRPLSSPASARSLRKGSIFAPSLPISATATATFEAPSSKPPNALATSNMASAGFMARSSPTLSPIAPIACAAACPSSSDALRFRANFVSPVLICSNSMPVTAAWRRSPSNVRTLSPVVSDRSSSAERVLIASAMKAVNEAPIPPIDTAASTTLVSFFSTAARAAEALSSAVMSKWTLCFFSAIRRSRTGIAPAARSSC